MELTKNQEPLLGNDAFTNLDIFTLIYKYFGAHDNLAHQEQKDNFPRHISRWS
jgi:hypothetical protein